MARSSSANGCHLQHGPAARRAGVHRLVVGVDRNASVVQILQGRGHGGSAAAESDNRPEHEHVESIS